MAPSTSNFDSTDEETSQRTFPMNRASEDKRGSGRIPGDAKRTETMFWNVMAIIMVGVLFLYASDSIQIQSAVQRSAHGDAFAEDVEIKHPSNINGKRSGAIPNVPTNSQPDAGTQQSPPSSPPKQSQQEDNVTQRDNDKTSKSTATIQTQTMKNGYEFPPTISVTFHGDTTYYTYKTRGQPMDDKTRQDMRNDWGSWTFDQTRSILTEDLYAKYPNRDVPRKDFPATAWQTDKNYLSKFLPEGIALVQRAQDAILAEYGQPSTGDWEERSKMFEITMMDEDLEGPELKDKKGKGFAGDNGGWTTPASWEGLKRRLLHAVMTEDSFVFAMTGHSSSAGHGNHFQQSYTLQVQWILEAVFARLGVRHQSRNFGNGGLGTVHNGIAAGSTFGPDVDVLMWDSGMTEKGDRKAVDVTHRQALLGGAKVPFLYTHDPEIAKLFHRITRIEVGAPGTGMLGIPEDQSNLTQIETEIAWAARYMNCDREINEICHDHEYDGVCWIDRPDVKPPTQQKDHPGGRAGWHPGDKVHRLAGRVIAFTFLQALKEALTLWNSAKDYEIPDEQWHMTSHYEKVRKQLYDHLDEGDCKQFQQFGVERFCKLPMKGRTEFTPRTYPSLSNIRTLTPPEMEIEQSPRPIYSPPDVFNPSLHPPKGAVDVLSIVEAGSPFQPVLIPDYVSEYYRKPKFKTPPKVPVGKGVELETYTGDEFCDGTVDSWCERGEGDFCLLSGHNDGRKGLMFDGYSGWVVMNIPDLKNGLIVVKMETWYGEGSFTKTKDWTSINNEEKVQRQLQQSNHWTPLSSEYNFTSSALSSQSRSGTNTSRHLKRKRKKQEIVFCDAFQFEYSVDGNITTVNGDEFKRLMQKGGIQRVINVFVLLDEPNYTGGEEREVEVAVRVTGCGRQRAMKLTHIYWS